MYTLDKQKFGTFVATLRKERGMTQKELANRLHTSDKAVSKWETGTSVPDVSLLVPLAEVLGVTVTELLRGEHVTQDLPLTETEDLVQTAMTVSDPAQDAWKRPALVLLLLAVSIVVLVSQPLFTAYPATLGDKPFVGRESVATSFFFAMFFMGFFACWLLSELYMGGMTLKRLLYTDFFLFNIPLWVCISYAAGANRIQEFYRHTLRQILDNTSATPFLVMGLWLAMAAVFHWHLLQGWRKQILAEAGARKIDKR